MVSNANNNNNNNNINDNTDNLNDNFINESNTNAMVMSMVMVGLGGRSLRVSKRSVLDQNYIKNLVHSMKDRTTNTNAQDDTKMKKKDDGKVEEELNASLFDGFDLVMRSHLSPSLACLDR